MTYDIQKDIEQVSLAIYSAMLTYYGNMREADGELADELAEAALEASEAVKIAKSANDTDVESKWMDIETAPKDGKFLIMLDNKEVYIHEEEGGDNTEWGPYDGNNQNT